MILFPLYLHLLFILVRFHYLMVDKNKKYIYFNQTNTGNTQDSTRQRWSESLCFNYFLGVFSQSCSLQNRAELFRPHKKLLFSNENYSQEQETRWKLIGRSICFRSLMRILVVSRITHLIQPCTAEIIFDCCSRGSADIARLKFLISYRFLFLFFWIKLIFVHFTRPECSFLL